MEYTVSYSFFGAVYGYETVVYRDEHCFDCHTESSDLVEGQVLSSLSRLITSLCTVLLAQQLTRCEWGGGETLITVLVRSVCQGNTCVTSLLRHVDKACGRIALLWAV